MSSDALVSFVTRTIDDLVIEDERSFRHVALYDDLKEALRRARYSFRVLPQGSSARWDRALFLNLTFWGADAEGDVLVEPHLDADVVAHVAWHHLARTALKSGSPAALFLGEAIASAFDLYLVGRLLGHAPKSSFLASQVPAMADSAEAAGLSDDAFEAMLQDIAREPERAFEDLRALLFDATTALHACKGASDALSVLTRLDDHRFAPLLHRYELSNWVLYARAYGVTTPGDARAEDVDRALRSAPDALAWLAKHWLVPAPA